MAKRRKKKVVPKKRTRASTGSASGVGTALGVGASLAAATGTATGTGGATGVGLGVTESNPSASTAPTVNLSTPGLTSGSPELGSPPLTSQSEIFPPVVTQHPIGVVEAVEAADTVDATVVTAHRPKAIKGRGRKLVSVRNKRQVLIQSRILIDAFEEALDYSPTARSNRSAPELRADLNLYDREAQSEIRELISELKKLNAFLEASKRATVVDRKNIIGVKKHLNTFLNSYAKTTGVGAGVLTLGLVSSLLYHLGAKEAVDLAMLWKSGRH